jgi:hypothetical protein
VRDDFETMGSDFERGLDARPQQAPPAAETVPAPDLADTANVETAPKSVAAAEPSTADAAPAAADEASSPAPQTSPPRPRGDDAAGVPAAAQPEGEAEPANATGRTG